MDDEKGAGDAGPAAGDGLAWDGGRGPGHAAGRLPAAKKRRKRMVFIGRKPGLGRFLGIGRTNLFPVGRSSGISRIYVICHGCRNEYLLEPEDWGNSRLVVLSKPSKCPKCGAWNVNEVEESD